MRWSLSLRLSGVCLILRIVLVLVLALALTGCKAARWASVDGTASEAGTLRADGGEKGGDNKHLRIQAFFDEQTEIVDSFRKANPDITVEWIKADGDFLDGLMSDSPPDLLIVDNGRIREINDMDIFEDLGGALYSGASSMQSWFPELHLEPYRSLDGKKLIAIPKDVPLNFTFYRADILEKYGFPSEPEALARYLEDSQSWLEMAKVLHAHNHWIFSYQSDPVYVVSNSFGYFGRDGSFVRNNESMVAAMDIAKEITESGLARNLNIWDENGKKAIVDDEIVMIYLGEWARNLLQQWDPEQAGHWQMTRLPLGQFSTQGGASFMVPKNAKNKLAAWSYIVHSMGEEAGYRDSLKGKHWYGKLAGRWVTPLDRRAEEIWDKEINEAQYAIDKSSEEILASIEEKVTFALNKDLMNMYEVSGGQ
ncbi:ABC transporter substrate-binding protein [Paenibacillus alkalitolerans]|uniref:ABC transporter substrate-binding protein n=1 Tax=Paenibacillus alkalitolerans TaxID=2799335 RepID=UPI001F2BFD78|nr:extracellular solute-binding protein [Paenibacillus alkalitolerans]